MKKFRLLFLALLPIFALSCDLLEGGEEENELNGNTATFTGTLTSDALSAPAEGVVIVVKYSADGETADISITGAKFNDEMPNFITFDFSEVPCYDGSIYQTGQVVAYYQGVPYDDRGTFHNFSFAVSTTELHGTFEICSETYELDYETFYFESTSVSVEENEEDDNSNEDDLEGNLGYGFTGTFGLDDGSYTQDADIEYLITFNDDDTLELEMNGIAFSGMPVTTDVTLSSLPYSLNSESGKYEVIFNGASIPVMGDYSITAMDFSFDMDGLQGCFLLSNGDEYAISGSVVADVAPSLE